MAKKLDIRSAMKSAAARPTPAEIDPFDHAEEVLKRRPTGYMTVEKEEAAKVQTTAAPAVKPKTLEHSVQKTTPAAIQTPETKVPTAPAVVADSESSLPKGSGLLGKPRYEEVPLDLIDENPYNARHIYLAEKVSELSNSLNQLGQLIPGLAAARGKRRLLIAGHYRKKAATLAGIKSLKLMVYDNVTDQDLYVLSYKENTEQTEQTPLDNALSWQKLLDDGIFTSEVAIGEKIGMSKANINKTLSILKLEPSVMAYVEQNPASYPLSVLYELVLLQKIAGAPVACDMAARVVDSGVGRKEILQARERHEAREGLPTRRRQHENARSYRLWNQDVNIGNIKEWDSGKVVVDVNFADQAEKQKFIEVIRTWMASQQAGSTASPTSTSATLSDFDEEK